MNCINRKIIAIFLDIYISDILIIFFLLFFTRIIGKTKDKIPANINSTVVIDKSIPQFLIFKIAQKTEKQKLKHTKQAG